MTEPPALQRATERADPMAPVLSPRLRPYDDRRRRCGSGLVKKRPREAILRMLEDCPEELAELRATLLQEHVWRKREGLV